MSDGLRGEFPVLYKVSREGLFDKMFEQSPIGGQVGKRGHVAMGTCSYLGKECFSQWEQDV